MPVITSGKEAKKAEDQDPDALDAKVPLMGSSDSLVRHLNADPHAVDAERVEREAMGGECEAQAVPPCEFAATLSQTYQPGTAFTIEGPLGPIKVNPPADAMPGMTLRYRLAPTPDFRVQVPPGGKPGSPVAFQRADGVEIVVHVPEGHGPGDSFDVTPPALMVRVPDGAEKGDFVIFHGPVAPDHQPEWFRAQVPDGLSPGRFLTARLPVPKPSKLNPKPKEGGWGAAWKAFRQEVSAEVKGSLQLVGLAGPPLDARRAAE